MSRTPPSLCQVCQRLDVQALLLAAEAAPSVHDGSSSPVHQALYTFFPHQTSLTNLRSSAGSCRLCAAVWADFCRQREQHELTPDALARGRADTQIWIGTLPWDTGATTVPHIAASQQTPDGQNNVILACFEACADYGTLPLPHDHLLARVQATSAANRQCFTLARSWLKDCHEKHSACQHAYPSNLFRPTRLLDVGLDADLEVHPNALVRLVQGEHSKGRYAALSYCWGPDRDLLLTLQSEPMLRQGFSASDMPGTLRDAVIVAQRTGIPYLWIDALCIYQDQRERQEARDDWARESGRMRDIYRNAVVTIEASSATRAKDSFLTSRRSLQPYCALPWGREDHEIYLRPASEVSEHELYASTIYSRGWTMQERLLAPRTLSFGASQMSFECANGFIDEAGRPSKASCAPAIHLSKVFMLQVRNDRSWLRSRTRTLFQRVGGTNVARLADPLQAGELLGQFFGGHLVRPNGKSQSYYDYWDELVERFSERRFTNNKDRLPALSGLADDFKTTLRDQYLCGIWRSSLLRGLAWTCGKVYNPAVWQASTTSNSQSPIAFAPSGAGSDTVTWPETVTTAEYIAPSWSWASVTGIIDQGKSTPQGSGQAKVIDVHIVPEHATDPYGRVASGHLILSTKFVLVPDPFAPCDAGHSLVDVHAALRSRHFDLNDEFATEPYQHHVPHQSQQFALILLWVSPRLTVNVNDGGRYTMLLIESCGPPSAGRPAAWRRLCCMVVAVERQSREEFCAADDYDGEYVEYLGRVWDSQDRISRGVRDAKWEKRTIKLV